MKIYFREPTPGTSGYFPILINCKLSARLKYKGHLIIDYFDTIINKPKYIPNMFDKILDFLKMVSRNTWDNQKWKELNSIGYVYFIKNGEYNQVKIGWSDRPSIREKELQTGNPNQLKIIGVLPSQESSVETFLHDRYKIYHIRGEWFKYEGELKTFIEDSGRILFL